MLHGRLTLSPSPGDAQFDLVWGQGGVQQAWGLGVPCWRLPFEILARLCGQPAFPDRLAFAIALALLNYILLRTLTVSAATTDLGSWRKQPPENLLAVFLLALCPPMLNFFCCPFNVYEEATAYGYLFAVGLLAGVMALAAQFSFQRYLLLCALSGLAAFIRPTVLAYGLATMAAALGCARAAGLPWRKALAGCGLFGCGGLLLLYTNFVRFGSPLEFGYGLQMNLMYELRFTGPFKHEPLLSAARELAGSIFFTQSFNDLEFLRPGIVLGQSDTPRWRNFYHSTFDATYLLGLIVFFCLGARWLARNKLRFRMGWAGPRPLVAIWCVLSLGLLSVFYLRCLAMSSRYILDFAPAIGATIVVGLWHFGKLRDKYGQGLALYFLAVITAWWAFEVSTASRSFKGHPLVLTQLEVVNGLRPPARFEPLPDVYYAESTPDTFGIPQNRQGWRDSLGETAPLVILFVNQPQEISLTLSQDSGKPISPDDYGRIQVKIGLEFLALKAVEQLGEVQRFTFLAPLKESCRQGIQVMYIGLGKPDDFCRAKSPYQLLAVSCRPTARPPAQGAVGLGSWNTQCSFTNMVVRQGAEILYQSDFDLSGTNGWRVRSGNWRVAGGCYQQTANVNDGCSSIGNTNWSNYTLTLRARKDGGNEGFLVLFDCLNDKNWTWWNIGGWNNTEDVVETMVGGIIHTIGAPKARGIATNRWYDVKIVLTPGRIQCYLDGQLVHDICRNQE